MALGIFFRPATESDDDFLRQLYKELRWDELASIHDWSDEQKTIFLLQQYHAQKSHYSKAYATDSEYLIIERDNQPIGRIYLYRGAPDDIRIIDIGLLKTERSKGYGQAILHTVFDEARNTGKSVSIHVEAFNPARRLYDRLGFMETGENGPYKLMVWYP